VYNPWQRFKLRHIPGPAYRPIFGNLLEIRQLGSHVFMQQCRERHGPVFKLWAGPLPWIIVADPDAGK
jgi:thromboxane-A synthase/cytochrome P450 family 3 subfamily A